MIGSEVRPLGPSPTFTFATVFSRDDEKIPTVFSPRLEVNTRSSASETSAPATRVRCGMERVGRAVDHVDDVVRGVRHVEQSPPAMDGRVVEPTRRPVWGKVNVADVFQRHAPLALGLRRS